MAAAQDTAQMDEHSISSNGSDTSASRQHRKIINVALNPNMRRWYYGLSGTPFRIDTNKSQLEVRSVLSAKLQLPICALELKEEEGIAVLNVQSFEAKAFNDDVNPTDCDCCGDGPAEGIFPMVLEDAEPCRSCHWCMPLCTRCIQASGLLQHCALCLGGEDPNTRGDSEGLRRHWYDDSEGLRRHWDMIDDRDRNWCRNIVRLYEASDAIVQEG